MKLTHNFRNLLENVLKFLARKHHADSNNDWQQWLENNDNCRPSYDYKCSGLMQRFTAKQWLIVRVSKNLKMISTLENQVVTLLILQY